VSETDLRAAIGGHRWLQSLRLHPDLVTPGLKPEAQLQAEEAALLDPLNLTGAHVLEVGAANGAFSFAALRRGAARALATDHLAWTLPGSDALLAAQWAAHALGAAPEMTPLDPRELSADFGSFHVVMAVASFDQLFNPIPALRGMRSVTERVLLLETAQDGLDDARPLMMAHGRVLPIGEPEGTWVFGWAPNPPLMTHLLTDLGFNRILYRNHPTLGAARGLYAAFLPEAPDSLLAGFNAPWISLTHPTQPDVGGA
jgi:tRNA (mo5U34)-methyltransferase